MKSVEQDRRCEVAIRKAGHSFLAVHRPLISWHIDVNSCPQDVCLPTGRDDKCPTSPFICTFGHKSIKGLIAQLPYSTCPLDILLQLHVFIPPQSLVHRRAPSGQQVKVKLTHHQLQAGSRLKGLSMVIIAISKKRQRLPLELASWHLQLSLPQNAGVSCQLFHMSKRLQKKRVGQLSVIQRRFMIQGPGQNTGVETKRLGSRVFSWLVKKSKHSLYIAMKNTNYDPFLLYLCLPVTIHLNIIVHLCT